MKRKHPLSGLMAFVIRSEWRHVYGRLLGEHLGPTLEGFGLTTEILIKLLGKSHVATLWGCVLEDLMTRYVGDEPTNVIDAYLGEAGQTELDDNRIYMIAVRSSAMSLYKVAENCCEGILGLNDVIRDWETFLVKRQLEIPSLVPGDWIATRLIPNGESYSVTGSLLSLSPRSVELLLNQLELMATALGIGPLESFSDDQLRLCTGLFTQAWLLEKMPSSFDIPSMADH